MNMDARRDGKERAGSAVFQKAAKAQYVLRRREIQIRPYLPVYIVFHDDVQHMAAGIYDGEQFVLNLLCGMFDQKGAAAGSGRRFIEKVSLGGGENRIFRPKQRNVLYDYLPADTAHGGKPAAGDRGGGISEYVHDFLSSFFVVHCGYHAFLQKVLFL